MFCKPDSRSYGLRRYTDYTLPSIPSSEGTFCRTQMRAPGGVRRQVGFKRLRSADRQPECFANPTAVVTAYAVIQIIPSPQSPPPRGLFVARICVLRIETVSGLQIFRLNSACNLRLPGWSPDANSRAYMQPERYANSPLRRRRARYFRQSGRIDRWRATADGDNAGVEKRHRHCRCGTKNAIFVL